MVNTTCKLYCIQAPVWYEIPGHVVSGDGFYYVPILESIQTLLSHPLVYDQVCISIYSYMYYTVKSL